MRVIPAVDVLSGRVVRLRRGDFGRAIEYGNDPVAAARRWVNWGADLVHVVDLDGARGGDPQVELWSALARQAIPFQIGGGIRTAALAVRGLEAGAARVVLGTAAVWQPEVLAEIGFAERVVAAVDVRAGRAMGSGWVAKGRPLWEVLDGLAASPVRRILLTGIERDGTLQGPDLGLITEVRHGAPEFSIIASGGVGSLADLAALATAGCDEVVVGRALYEGTFTLAEAITASG